MRSFPIDDTTLVLLDAACQINPDSGHTELLTFLDLGSRIASEQQIGDAGGIPIVEVEFEEGYEPWSPNDVIRALIAEVQRLRREKLVPRWRAIIEAQRQHITRLEGQNERLRDRLETTAYLYHGCMCDDPVPSAFADCRTSICIDNRTALSHSAPKVGP